MSEGDRVAARHRLTGTQTGPFGDHPATGRSMTARYLAMYRLRAGVIVEAWAEWDNLSVLMQIGLTAGRAPADLSLHDLLDDHYGPAYTTPTRPTTTPTSRGC